MTGVVAMVMTGAQRGGWHPRGAGHGRPAGRARRSAPGPTGSVQRRCHSARAERAARVAAHAVDPPAGRGRRRAQVQAGRRGPVVVPADRGAEDRLAQGGHAAGDVAADVVGVGPLGLRRRLGRPGQHQVAEARAQSARSGPRSARSCRPTSPRARGSRPTACAGRPGRGSGPPPRAGPPDRRAARGGDRRPPRPRWRPPPRTSRRRGRSRPAGTPAPPRAPARSAPSRPCRRPVRSGTARAPPGRRR